MSKPLSLTLMLFLMTLSTHSQACELTMGYRTNAKPPFIAEMPDNNGLYRDLYTEASRRIGCQLTIVRQPKGRIMHLIKNGEIDFYPGLSFSQQRSEFAAFIANGLKDGNIGLSRADEPEILSMQDVAERKMIMVVSFGGFDQNAEAFGIHVRHPYDYTLDEIVDLILSKRADFHAYNLLAIEHYLLTHPEKAKQLKRHSRCCGPTIPMYLGFSKRSPHLALTANPDFDPALPAYNPERADHILNLPNRISPDSVAGRLQQTLEAMQSDGTFQRIYRNYFGTGAL